MAFHRTVLAVGLVLLGVQLLPGQVVDEEELESVESSSQQPPSRPAEDLAPVAKLIVSKTNDFRGSQERSPVESNQQLTEAAQYFANYMARTDRYGHTADGQRPSGRAKEHGYEYCMVAENIAYQFSTAEIQNEELAERFVEGWKDSPEHRENMLEPYVVETGVAVAQSAKSGYYYAVQMFGRPKSMSIEFSIKNEAGQPVHYTIADHTFTLPPRYTRTHTSCRPPQVQLTLGEDEDNEKRTLKPDGGESYVVASENGALQVQKQEEEQTE